MQSIDHPLSRLLLPLLTSVRALLTLDQNLVEQAKNELEPVKLVGRIGGGRRGMEDGGREKEEGGCVTTVLTLMIQICIL